MTQNYLDPKTYLSTMTSRRGKSGAKGVYVANVTIVAEALADYNYKVNFSRTTPFVSPTSASDVEWYSLLINLRADSSQQPQVLPFSDGIYQFVPEGSQISLNVFLPNLEVEMFEYHVTVAQDILQCVADFTGKVATSIRFSIGYASRTWEDLVEDGEVEERELTY